MNIKKEEILNMLLAGMSDSQPRFLTSGLSYTITNSRKMWTEEEIEKSRKKREEERQRGQS
jgi:hypothetical protein